MAPPSSVFRFLPQTLNWPTSLLKSPAIWERSSADWLSSVAIVPVFAMDSDASSTLPLMAVAASETSWLRLERSSAPVATWEMFLAISEMPLLASTTFLEMSWMPMLAWPICSALYLDGLVLGVDGDLDFADQRADLVYDLATAKSARRIRRCSCAFR
jgi:hypothetical protein